MIAKLFARERTHVTPAGRTPGRLLFPLWLTAMAGLCGCGGGGGGGASGSTGSATGRLVSVQYGRLVDIYAYERLDPARGDRRDRLNRQGVLVARNVPVNPSIETQPLFDATGGEIPDANFEFRPFDVQTGHEELTILWDDRTGPEQERFNVALALAKTGLVEIPDSYRGQNSATHPIPVVPRNAAIKLTFGGPLGIDDSFFQVNPAALQVLEFKGDPSASAPGAAFRAVIARILVQGDSIIVDPSILGREGGGGTTSTGLPSSVDNVTANIRIAIPSNGAISSAFHVQRDPVANLNGSDGFGRDSVIRDFRSGNLSDGRFGTLSDTERPMIVGNLDMGITDVDAANRIITLNKRFHQVPVRGRLPFVDGTLNPTTGLPNGPAGVPTLTALRSGDYLVQLVDVRLPDNSVERVRVRAEIMQNMDIVTEQGQPNPGRTPQGSQGQTAVIARVKVASLNAGTDSLGRPVSFVASTLPEGADCTLRNLYYEDVRFTDGNGTVSDAAWRYEFLVFDPKPPRLGANQQPLPPGTGIDPLATVSIGFSEPMDLERVDPSSNLVISNSTFTAANFGSLIGEPKPAGLSIVASRLTDQAADGTLLQLAPQLGLGHFHQQNNAESYFFHVLLSASGAADLAGNPVQIYDDPRAPVASWSVNYTLEPTRPDNLIGSHLYRFEDVDEDGTPFGSVDAFGQFRIQDGRLLGADTVRFNRQADNQNLGGISRINRGECWLPGTATTPGQLIFPTNPANGGNLYWQPRMFDTVFPPNVPAVFLPPNTPQSVGRVIEPHQPRGSRMMMRYLEDDFSLSYTHANEFMLDVEQLYWSPFNDENVLYDVFDRYTMLLAHGDKRPDEHFTFVGGMMPVCRFDCPAVSSSLSATFTDNILQGSTQTTVFEDQVYQINPNDAFRASTGTKFVPYPKFQHTYTWRDSRLVTLDENNNLVGLGGARDPGNGSQLSNDWTADVDSPWVTSRPDLYLVTVVPGSLGPPPVPPVTRPASDFPGTTFVLDEADFRGTRKRDHDPIALPLLVDFMVFPDDARNGIAAGVNAFQIAMVGPPSNFPAGNPGGYYNQVGVGCAGRNPWPWTRIHTTGGLDPNTNQNILIDPANSPVALGGWIKDAGLGDPIQGLFHAPPGDGHLHWAQADFVRKVSMATFGFFDTLKPNQHALPATLSTNWPNWTGLTNQNGFPNFDAVNNSLRIRDLVTQMDPPISRQPAGTGVVLEIRGANTFANATIYNRSATGGTPPANTGDLYDTRGNLLNPNYACEAYRYSKPNARANNDLPRIDAQGLTKYVTEDRINELRSQASGLLPRYLNIRLVMTNNVDVTPAISPSLRSLALVYRMVAP